MDDAGHDGEGGRPETAAEGLDLGGRLTPVPAPWRLQGHGYGLLYRLPRGAVDVDGALPEGLAERYVGGTAALIVADYVDSDVGPYQEMLFVPGRFRDHGGSFYSVTRGFVSSSAPAASGRLNWGLPREVAQITFEPRGGDERVTVRREGRTLATFTFRSGRLGLPATTEVVPSASRTIMQRAGSRTFFTTVGGRGTLRRARLLEASVETGLLPDLTRYQPFMAVRLEAFQLALPRPRVVDLDTSEA